MAKKVLIISTSLRGGSNSDILANECAKGAKEVGHDVELLSLKGKDIKYCIGCLSCQRNGLQGWVDCFAKASLKGMVGGGGIDAANIAASHADVMKKAYELGKKL